MDNGIFLVVFGWTAFFLGMLRVLYEISKDPSRVVREEIAKERRGAQ